MDYIDLGNRIKKKRLEKNLTQEVLAEMSKISCAYMGQIERGESSLSLKTLDRIVSFTGVSTDFILYGDESQNSYVKKINRILKHCSDDTICFIYKMINELYHFAESYKSL